VRPRIPRKAIAKTLASSQLIALVLETFNIGARYRFSDLGI
jgi:hypothetical protein